MICTYLLPIRREKFFEDEASELANYFRRLSEAGCEVVVIDGSRRPVFDQHAAYWEGIARHEPVDQRFKFLNDKVNGIHTGVRLAAAENIILADDDIRYLPEQVRLVCDQLNSVEVVRPQNFLSPLPWWGYLEAVRMLINRATLWSGDYPGTCAFRRSTFLGSGEYDGDVLFDNEEIIRHFARHGARIDYAIDLFIEKKAPRFRKWLEQRPRQAYEDFPLRGKTVLFATIIPLALTLFIFAGSLALIAFMVLIVLAAILLAVMGRRRGAARKFFPASIPLFAPFWVLERGFSTYWALGWRVLRGGYPFGERILKRGVGRDWFAGADAQRKHARARSR
jgi:hypothetical protein